MSRVAVAGATGYSGAELVRILAVHPEVSRLDLYASEGGGARRFEEVFPALRHLYRGPVLPFDPDRVRGADAAFLALPHGASGAAAAEIAGGVGVVVDLSGDLRLRDASVYERWYGRPHPAPDLLGRAVYGLPELFGADLPGARLVANPGCYATAAALALAPALEESGLCGEDAVVTAISGASGAGRNGQVHLLLSELHANAWAYRLGSHQHVPEIAASLDRAGGRPVSLTFVPQVVPLERGILAVASLPLRGPGADAAAVEALYARRYAGRPFVRIVPGRSPAIREVAGTNFCDLGVAVDPEGGRLVVVAALDNLVKGAAGQAVQNWNLAAGLPETDGLLAAETRPAAARMED